MSTDICIDKVYWPWSEIEVMIYVYVCHMTL